MNNVKSWVVLLWMSCLKHPIFNTDGNQTMYIRSVFAASTYQSDDLNLKKRILDNYKQNQPRSKWTFPKSAANTAFVTQHCNITSESGVNVSRCFIDRAGGRAIPCDRPVAVGTTVSFQCPFLYKPYSVTSRCKKGGFWSQKIRCSPVCGIRKRQRPVLNKPLPLIMHGTSANSSQWPWVAALFRRQNEAAQWEYACGATLVSEIALITAAHCLEKGARARNILITLGHLSNKIPTLNDTGVYKVRTFAMLPLYKGRGNQFDSDISIIILKSTVQLSENIIPACIPNIDNVPQARHGIVAGWGLDENYNRVNTLHYTYLPIVNNTACLSHSPEEYVKFFSFTKFCAGYVNGNAPNGTGVCNGDSGSGLLTKENGRWYLHGVVSTSPPNGRSLKCSRRNYTLFTKAGCFIPVVGKNVQRMDCEISCL